MFLAGADVHPETTFIVTDPCPRCHHPGDAASPQAHLETSPSAGKNASILKHGTELPGDGGPMTPPRPSRDFDLGVLAGACLVTMLAFLLQVRPDQRVALRGLSRFPLPHVCASRVWLGVDCPTCGLTRSLIYLARGDWRGSVRAHRLGWLVAALIVIQIPARTRALALRRAGPHRVGLAVSRLLAPLMGVLMGNWLLERLR